MSREEVLLQIIKKQSELIELYKIAGVDFSNGAYVPAAVTVPTAKTKGFDRAGFERYLAVKGRSSATVDSYMTTLKCYFEKYDEISDDNLASFDKWLLDDSGMKEKSQHAKIQGMNAYLKYIEYKPFEWIPRRIQAKTFCDNVFTEKEYNKLCEWAKVNKPKLYVIARVIGMTGVRVSELIELKTEDLQTGYRDIKSKANKTRRIFFPKQLIDDIKGLTGNVYIIENRYGEQMTTRGILHYMQENAEAAGIPKELMHPHGLRHFFAKQFLKHNNDITLLGDLLGHSNIATTSIYTRLTSSEQKKKISTIVKW